jgi:arginase family enzyme
MAVRLLGLPQDTNASFLAGSALAPNRIREALHSDSANMFTHPAMAHRFAVRLHILVAADHRGHESQ